MKFPGADRTVSVQRDEIVTLFDGFNQDRAPVVLYTGIPIHLRDLNSQIISVDAGAEVLTEYRGAVAKTADILVGDLLLDETQSTPHGPVQYEVHGAVRNFAYLKLHLRRVSFQ